jgi:hypothetical protein
MLQSGGTLVLAAALTFGAQKAGKAPKTPPPRTVVERPNAGVRGGVPKGLPKAGRPGGNNLAEQLILMPPEARDRALEKLPPAAQVRLRKRLEEFDSLPPPERERRLRDLRRLAQLTPEVQQQVRLDRQAFNNLPDDRKRRVRQEYRRLSFMSDSDRRARLASEEFKSAFSPSEQQILSNLSENFPLIPDR